MAMIGSPRSATGTISTPVPAFPITWTELGPEGALIARAVLPGTSGTVCPPITIDGTDHETTTRGSRTPEFDITVCEGAIPPATKVATLLGQRLPLLPKTPRKIAIVGDTGCRLNQYDGFQACNDPAAWPFATVARSIAAWQPDLIIHVGDYLYREHACPDGNTGCAGSPHGDTWPTWEADFFAPAGPLLRQAPILFLRGNHEICERAGNGWFRLLDPRPFPAACQTYTEPYVVPIGGLRLLVMDSAEAGDTKTSPEETAAYEAQFATIAQLAGNDDWFISHKPLVGVIENKDGARIEVHNGSFQAATGSAVAPGVSLAIAGHIHLAELLTFDADSGQPAQLVAGNGGTMLDRDYTGTLAADALGDDRLASGDTVEQFGFLTLEQTGNGWVMTQRDQLGHPGTTCEFTADLSSCTPRGTRNEAQ